MKFLEDDSATKIIFRKSSSEETDKVYSNLIDAMREKCAQVVQMADPRVAKATVLTDTSSGMCSPVHSPEESIDE